MVVLEDIRDPHNAAAVFRSCDAFGIQKIGLIHERQKPFDPMGRLEKDMSASTNRWLDFEAWTSTRDCLTELKRRGYSILATAIDPRAEPLTTLHLDEPDIAILFGNEHRGLSHTAIHMADRIAVIPTRGMVQSLNVSVSAAIVLHHVTTRRAANPRYALPDAERRDLARRWFEFDRRKHPNSADASCEDLLTPTERDTTAAG